jgi:hypothetical protein
MHATDFPHKITPKYFIFKKFFLFYGNFTDFLVFFSVIFLVFLSKIAIKGKFFQIFSGAFFKK